MEEATIISNQVAEYSIDVCKADGTLRYREVSIPPPEMPPEPQLKCPNCMPEYMREFATWQKECKAIVEYYEAIREYHTARCNYCMAHRNDTIEEKYRTGDDIPATIEKAKKEIKKLRKLID